MRASPTENEKGIPESKPSRLNGKPEENVTEKRPGSGISPMEYWDVIGKTAQADIFQDELITS